MAATCSAEQISMSQNSIDIDKCVSFVTDYNQFASHAKKVTFCSFLKDIFIHIPCYN
jgi:hypothetical protein